MYFNRKNEHARAVVNGRFYMRFSLTFVLLVLFFIAESPKTAAFAQGLVGARVVTEQTRVKSINEAYDSLVAQRITANWSGEKRSCKNSTTVIFHIAPDGKVDSAQIFESSGDSVQDFYCLQAVLSCSPLPAVPKSSDRNQYNGAPGRITFKPDQLSIIKTYAISADTFLTPAIPLDVLRRYPGTITAAELMSFENQRRISTGAIQMTIAPNSSKGLVLDNKELLHYIQKWAPFFEMHKTASKAAILKHRRAMDLKYARLFVKSGNG